MKEDFHQLYGYIELWSLHAYMNLTRFKKEYKIYGCSGILEALWVMSPEWTKG